MMKLLLAKSLYRAAAFYRGLLALVRRERFVYVVMRGTTAKTAHLEVVFRKRPDAESHLAGYPAHKRKRRFVIAVPLNG